jgi:hypothetical protein
MEQQEREGSGKVQVIDNRVQIDCLVINPGITKSDSNHSSFTIQIENITPVAGYPDLVSGQNLAELELKVRNDDILKLGNLKGKRISCQVMWAPKNRVFAIKGTLQVLGRR